jgi:predicted Fe-Mo cluster-binding NifX family protein
MTAAAVRRRIEKEQPLAKIAVSSEGPGLDDLVDPRFGRAGGFVIIDTETMGSSYVDNGSSQTMARGAGLQAAENVAGAGVEAVLTGMVGPKAYKALEAAGIKVVEGLEGTSVRQAAERYKAGDLSFAEKPGGGPAA